MKIYEERMRSAHTTGARNYRMIKELSIRKTRLQCMFIYIYVYMFENIKIFSE